MEDTRSNSELMLDARKIRYTSGNAKKYSINSSFKGMIKQGNIDIANRPSVTLSDGSTATVRSINISIDKKGTQVLIPTIGPAGENWTIKQAINHYLATGENLGFFKDEASAEDYAVSLHNQQDKQYVSGTQDTNSDDSFSSATDAFVAMSNPDYTANEQYRQNVQNKIQNSNLFE